MRVRKANRMKGYDYSKDNLYFVTICVHNRINYFGEIPVGTGRDLSNLITNTLSNNNGDTSNKMVLNEYGKIAEQQWHWLAKQYPYIILHAFVVMPNHIHGIIEINRNIVGTGRDLSDLKMNDLSDLKMNDLSDYNDNPSIYTNDMSINLDDIFNNDGDIATGTGGNISMGTGDDIATGTGRDLSLPKIKSLSELMGAYKTTVSKQIHLLENNDRIKPVNTFAWQRSFHDHIIRNNESYQKIYNYIINNPHKWAEDKFYNYGK